MPTVRRIKGYKILFYSADGDEPPHVHVKREKREAKFWLNPAVRLAKNGGFRPHQLAEIERILTKDRVVLLESWDAYFGR